MEILEAKNRIMSGEVIKLPTDTVYGYICDAYNEVAIEKIYELKKRDKKKPLGIFVENINEFYKIIDGGEKEIKEDIKNILIKNWPGALTVICNKKQNVLEKLNDGINTIGVRIPKDDFILALIKEVGHPLAQTSANISGENDISSNKENGKSTIASTIIDITKNKIDIIRQGDVRI